MPTSEDVENELTILKRIVSGARQLADLAESIGHKGDAEQLRIFAERREPIVQQCEEDEQRKGSAEIIPLTPDT